MQSKDVSKIERIAVHDGAFHSDDVFAAAALLHLNPSIKVIRTRDSKTLENVDMRVDVGLKHNPGTGDYDHHQGAGQRENGVPYAAFGLIWKDYGASVCGKLMENAPIDQNMCRGISLNMDWREVAEIVDNDLVQPLDDYDVNWRPKLQDNRRAVLLQDVVNRGKPVFYLEGDMDAGFEGEVGNAKRTISNYVFNAGGSLLAERFVEKALQDNKEPGILVMNYNKSIPMEILGKHLANLDSSFLYCVQTFDDNQAAVFTIRDGDNVRKPMPNEWAGLDGEKLRSATGVPNANYCFKQISAFAESFGGALQLARKARDWEI